MYVQKIFYAFECISNFNVNYFNFWWIFTLESIKTQKIKMQIYVGWSDLDLIVIGPYSLIYLALGLRLHIYTQRMRKCWAIDCELLCMQIRLPSIRKYSINCILIERSINTKRDYLIMQYCNKMACLVHGPC